MEQNDNAVPAWYKDGNERLLAEHIIGLEKSALERFFNGDMSGYRELWSKRSFTYFDAVVTQRVESFAGMENFLDNIEGKLHSDDYRFVSPRVQFGQDMAILTYQLFAHTNFNDIEYNCIEVFQKEGDSEWHVVHSTWSTIRPMDKYFKPVEQTV